MSVERGRPPGLAGGISGSSNRNWSSVSAWPEPKSPTNARSVNVHMAVSRQETACNAARRARISPSRQPRHPSQTGTKAQLRGRAALLGAGQELLRGVALPAAGVLAAHSLLLVSERRKGAADREAREVRGAARRLRRVRSHL